MKYGTLYIESDMVLAAQAGDWEEVESLVQKLTPVEARKLRRALLEISGYLEFRGREKMTTSNDNSNNRR